ncbi:6-phosphogluconolactonase [Mucilaginibacter sp. Bleaf8]|uniref:6-phosphogluconolactonase n=1 Tax=Mucilaginibacter sp. Bleaf8 TaxID=2834430 RepID=UPI001BCD8A94|nr:6-phosphogluconolactonase [Mucilaginibacter sp. Bleaf8]MBS7563938.1 6-phosphogluconolactonase [Mucilaginibacter sp. Bleaf8]
MIQIFDNSAELSTAAADLFVQSAAQAIGEKGTFTVALTGGSSPVQLHKLLAQAQYRDMVDWEKTYIFWGDERWVPMTDDRSNAKMAFDTLLNHVPIPHENIFPMYDYQKQPEEFAAYYEDVVRKQVPNGEFDLILLGMGDDGHTASLFPGTAVLHEQTKWVDAYYLAPQSMHRITLTAPLINRAKKIALMLFGTGKANALHEVLEGERNPEKYPSQLLNPSSGDIVWLVDSDAASKLTQSQTNS